MSVLSPCPHLTRGESSSSFSGSAWNGACHFAATVTYGAGSLGLGYLNPILTTFTLEVISIILTLMPSCKSWSFRLDLHQLFLKLKSNLPSLVGILSPRGSIAQVWSSSGADTIYFFWTNLFSAVAWSLYVCVCSNILNILVLWFFFTQKFGFSNSKTYAPSLDHLQLEIHYNLKFTLFHSEIFTPKITLFWTEVSWYWTEITVLPVCVGFQLSPYQGVRSHCMQL